MKNLFNREVSSWKAICIIAVFAVLAAGLVVASITAFNIMPGDLKTLRFANQTQGGSWADSITANAGDQVAIRVYYHCGTDDPAWTNVRAYGTSVRVDFPTAQQTSIVPSAQVSATNLASITDTGTISVSSSQKLIFDNTAHWYEGPIDHGMIAVSVSNGSVQVNLGDMRCDPLNPPCYTQKGFVIFTATVSSIFPAPTVDLKANGYDGTITIPYNTAATLSWTSTNATSCTASGDWSGAKVVSGSQSTGNLTSNKSYTLSCTGPGGGPVSDTVSVNVQAQAPTVDLKANGYDGTITIPYNTAATLSWISTNATSCTASGDWSGAKVVSGSESTGNLTSSKNYTIICSGPGGTSSPDIVGVTVQVSPPTVDLKANGSNGPITIQYNAAATLTWLTTNNPTTCTASGSWFGSKSTSSGSESTGNLTATQNNYVLTCSNTAGSANDSVLVQVIYCMPAPPEAPF